MEMYTDIQQLNRAPRVMRKQSNVDHQAVLTQGMEQETIKLEEKGKEGKESISFKKSTKPPSESGLNNIFRLEKSEDSGEQLDLGIELEQLPLRPASLLAAEVQKKNKERQFLDYINFEDIIEYIRESKQITEEGKQFIENYKTSNVEIDDDEKFKEIMESIIPNDITRYLIEKKNEKLIEDIIEYMWGSNQITEEDKQFIESYKTGKLGVDGEERFKKKMERIILYEIPQYLIEKEKEKENEKEKFKRGSDTLQNGGQCGEDSELRAMIEQLQYAEHIWEFDGSNRAFDGLGENFKRLQDRAFIHVYDITDDQGGEFKGDYIRFKVRQFDPIGYPANIRNMTTSPELIDNWKKYIHKRGDKFNNIQQPASRISRRGREELKRFKMTVTKTELITGNFLENGEKYLLTTRSMHPMFVIMDVENICRNLNSQRRWLYNESIFHGIPDQGDIIGNIKNPGNHLENLEEGPPKWKNLDVLPYRASSESNIEKIGMYAARLWSIELYGIYSSFTKIERNTRAGDEEILNQYSLFKGALTGFIEKCSHYIPLQFFKFREAFDNALNVRARMGPNIILDETLKNVYNTIQKKHVKLYRGECRVFNKSFLIEGDKDFIPSAGAPKQKNTFTIDNNNPNGDEINNYIKINFTSNGEVVEFVRGPQDRVSLNNTGIPLILDSFTATTPDINTAINFTSHHWCENNIDESSNGSYIKVIYEYVNFDEGMCAYLGYFGIPSEHEVLFKSETPITVTNVVPHKRGNDGLEKLTAADVEGGIHGNDDIYLVVTCDCGAR
jgi:hypothetical protein